MLRQKVPDQVAILVPPIRFLGFRFELRDFHGNCTRPLSLLYDFGCHRLLALLDSYAVIARTLPRNAPYPTTFDEKVTYGKTSGICES